MTDEEVNKYKNLLNNEEKEKTIVKHEVYKVLIVDDSTVDLRVIEEGVRKAFKDRGVRVEIRTAHHSGEAEDIMMLDGFRPIDLILADYNMTPGRNGIDMKKWISLREATKHLSDTPYVIVSGYSYPELIDAAEEAGVQEWLMKTVSPLSFQRLIDFIITTRRIE